jgi:hypothetical protein
MILNKNIRRKSQTKLRRKSNNKLRISRKNQKGGNFFLALDQPRIGGLAEVSYLDDLYAQSAPNINVANINPKIENINNCLKGGFNRHRLINNKLNYMGNKIMKGGNGNFSPDMNTRKFDCIQPNWSTDCV